jgi:hypothetical protein
MISKKKLLYLIELKSETKHSHIYKLPAIMRKTLFTIIFSIGLCSQIFGQNGIYVDPFTISVRPIKPDTEIKLCVDSEVYGRIREFEVVEISDQAIFGKKIYAIESCREFIEWPSANKNYNVKKLYNRDVFKLVLKFQRPKYLEGVYIENEALLKNNVGGQEFYIEDLYELYLSYGKIKIRR